MKSSKSDNLIIIGSGITGLMTAINAKLSGLDVYLVEKGDQPSGTSVRIAGVLHSGARFAGWDDDLAKTCFEEWKWWISVLDKEKREVGGYFIKLKGEPEQYLENWLNSLKAIGIPYTEIDNPEIGKDINNDSIERYYFVPEIKINARYITNELTEIAKRLGINYYTSSTIKEAELQGNEYKIAISGKNEITVKGFPIITSGIEIPEVAKKFGINLQYSVYQGSHILLNTNISEILELIHQPKTYDLFIPTEMGTYVTPTLAPYNNLIIGKEEINGFRNAVKGLFINEPDIIGYITAGRISITWPKSDIKTDYMTNTNNAIIAWSNNYACSRRVSYSIAETLGIKKALTYKLFNLF